MIKPPLPELARDPRFVAPSIPPTPDLRPWWRKFLERKFVAAVLLSVSGVLAWKSGAAPLSFELVLWIVGPIVAWMGFETGLDLKRISIPQVPGYWDDAARILLQLGQAASPSGQEAAPSTRENASGVRPS